MRTEAENTRVGEELMSGCQQDEDWGEDSRRPWTDHQAIAGEILAGTTKKEILEMEEFERWPESYEWVSNELSDDTEDEGDEGDED